MGVSGLIAAQARSTRVQLLSPAAKRTIRRSFALSWLSTLGMIGTFLAVGWMVDALFGVRWPQGYFWFSARMVPPSLWFSKVTMALCVVVVFAATWGRSVAQARGQIREENLVRRRILAAIFRVGPARLSSKKTGDLVAMATESAEKLMLFRQGFVADVLASFSSPLLILAALAFFLDPVSALVLLVFVPLIPALVVGFEKVYAKVSSSSRRARGRLAAAYLDAISGLTTLRLLGAAGRVGQDLERKGEDNRQSIMKLLRGNQLVLFVIDIGFSLCMITVAVALAAWRTNTGYLTLGGAIALLGLAVLLLEPMDQVGAFFYVGMGGMAASRAISAFLKASEGGDAVAGTVAAEGVAATEIAEDASIAKDAPARQSDALSQADALSPGSAIIDLSDVHFSYGDKEVLSGVNLQVYPSEKVALVGPSGQGKSTLLAVMKGFLDPTAGVARVAGATDGGGRRSASAFVSQQTWLFSGTVADNLKLVNPDLTEEQMWDCLQRSLLADEVRSLPQGLYTQIGEQGHSLSGGQSQRLSLARSLASGRKLLLLDEPTSQVDLISESKILQAISALGPQYTLVMVTHRRSSVAQMDRIFAVREGSLTQIDRADFLGGGSHD